MYQLQMDPQKQRDSKTNADYKTTIASFTKSGEHDSNFFNYCHGRYDLYYLRLLLVHEKPDLVGVVVANLPDNYFFDSELKISKNSSNFFE